MSRERNWNWLIYPAAALGALLLVGASVMSSFARAYNVPASSMLPNLLVGDHLWAWRDHYAEHAPERGEIALFLLRDNVFIKRVIGLPGDTIEMKAGRLWINGAEVERQEDGAFTDTEYGRTFQRYRETLPNGASYAILEADDASMLDTAGPVHVPADSYFMMGDNRDNSNDSRVPDFGAVPREKFTDRPFLIYFSKTLDRIGSRIN
jgi:signal peptidase I